MKIARVTAVPLHVPLYIKLVGVDRETSLACCHVEVETDRPRPHQLRNAER